MERPHGDPSALSVRLGTELRMVYLQVAFRGSLDLDHGNSEAIVEEEVG